MNKNELKSRLLLFDEEVSLLFDKRNFKCIIVGGGALLILEFISRATLDIDIIDASREIIPLFDKYDMNEKVSGLIYRFPYNFEDRLIKIPIETKSVHFYSLSLEDLVVSKLYAGRIKDQQDIRNVNILKKIDWEKLHELVIEAKLSTLNEREYSELLTSYEEYLLLKE